MQDLISTRRIEVVPYDTRWVEAFIAEKQALEQALCGVGMQIEHIGSTSVPGLVAKPTIDILLTVSSLAALDEKSVLFAQLDYVVKGEHGISGRRYYQKGGDKRTFHVHGFKQGDSNIIAHRAFSAYLRHNAMARVEYMNVKYSALRESGGDSRRYSEMKGQFVQQTLPLALKWFKNSRSGQDLP